MIDTNVAAQRLGVTRRRVQMLIKQARLPARRYGRGLFIKEADLALVADRKPGRPKKRTG